MKNRGFRLSRSARKDLVAIGRYTTETWGPKQCRRYLGELDARMAALAKDPASGRACDELRTGYRRFHQGRHVIFYRVGARGVVEIIRILHERMLPELHF